MVSVDQKELDFFLKKSKPLFPEKEIYFLLGFCPLIEGGKGSSRKEHIHSALHYTSYKCKKK